MSPEEFKDAAKRLNNWIAELLPQYANQARTVNSLPFQRMRSFFSDDLLRQTKAVVVNEIPVPPLSSMGLPQFSAFETNDFRGITFLDTYFVLGTEALDEALHVHEMVHIVQWRVLGPELFLMLYAWGLENNPEYRANPLEEMAYRHQERFSAGNEPYSIEAMVEDETRALLRRQEDPKAVEESDAQVTDAYEKEWFKELCADVDSSFFREWTNDDPVRPTNNAYRLLTVIRKRFKAMAGRRWAKYRTLQEKGDFEGAEDLRAFATLWYRVESSISCMLPKASETAQSLVFRLDEFREPIHASGVVATAAMFTWNNQSVAVVLVKDHVTESPRVRQECLEGLTPTFPNSIIIFAVKNSNGTITFFGEEKLAAALAKHDPKEFDWKLFDIP